MSSHATVGPARRVAAAASLIGLIAALALVGPLSEPSHAADFEVDSSASWETAVANAAANTGEITTSTITDDFTYDTAGTPAYAGDGFELLVDGRGHTVTASASNTSSFLDASTGAGKITLRDLSLVGSEANNVACPQTTGNIIVDNITVTNALSHDCVTWESAAGYSPTPPAGVSFPHGIFGYCFTLPEDGWSVDITLNLPSRVSQLWKITDSTWAEVTDVVIDGATVTYSITDGGALDDDGAVDGEILDPVAPGIGAAFTG